MLKTGMLVQGRYEIIRSLAQGGMGVVYEAQDHRLHDRVAIKQLIYTGAVGPQTFEREARFLGKLRHHNLPRVIDHFTDSTGQFLVMDYVEGTDLGQILAQRNAPCDVKSVLDWMTQLLTVLEYLHSHSPPILHRDIKPSNIKIDSNNRLMLLDFGLAKGQSLTHNLSVMGYTLHYAPLEQIQGQGTGIWSDLYAVGATAYHLLINQQPIDAISRAASLVRGQPDPLIAPIQLNSAIPTTLNTLILDLLAQNWDQRPSTATEVKQRLDLIQLEIDSLKMSGKHSQPKAHVVNQTSSAGQITIVTGSLKKVTAANAAGLQLQPSVSSKRRMALLITFLLFLGVVLIGLFLPEGTPIVKIISPEDRVKNFFNDISAAFNDPKLSEAATQDEWATKLSMYFLPSDQAKQKAEMKTSLTEMSAGGAASGTLKIEGITTEKVSESGDNAEVKITGGKMTVSFAGQSQELDLAKENPFATSGNPKLKKENGIWYILDDTPSDK